MERVFAGAFNCPVSGLGNHKGCPYESSRLVGLVGGVPVCLFRFFFWRAFARVGSFERRRVAVSRIGDALSALGFASTERRRQAAAPTLGKHIADCLASSPAPSPQAKCCIRSARRGSAESGMRSTIVSDLRRVVSRRLPLGSRWRNLHGCASVHCCTSFPAHCFVYSRRLAAGLPWPMARPRRSRAPARSGLGARVAGAVCSRFGLPSVSPVRGL